MQEMCLVATAAFGLEAVVAHELRALGYDNLSTTNGRVAFHADISAIPRCNLWLRSADRLLIQVGQFKAATFDELFEQTRTLPWPDLLPENACFPVQGKSIKSRLFSVSDCQAIVKKAIVEKMKTRYHRKWFDETGPRYKIEVGLLNDTATLTIDTSGAGLHKRGYRKLSHRAPLKETLAAALVQLSRWRSDRAFIDPFCGSGTIPIEAALIGRNMAPGLFRNFDAEYWPTAPIGLWQKARQEARDLIKARPCSGIQGFDIDSESILMARFHADQAGLKKDIHFEHKNIKDIVSPFEFGYLIGNPPYGERIAERTQLNELYKDMSDLLERLNTWSFYILSAELNLDKRLGRKPDKKRKLYNGRLLCCLFQFFGPKPPIPSGPFAG